MSVIIGPSVLRRGISEPETPTFSARLEASKSSDLPVSAHSRTESTGLYKPASLLHGCWNLNSGHQDCIETASNSRAISSGPCMDF